MNGARLHVFDARNVSGEDSPYVTATFLPNRKQVAKTAVSKVKGLNPKWDEMIRLKPDKEATSLLLELWNENMFADTLLASAEVDFSDYDALTGSSHGFKLDTGGKLNAAITCSGVGGAKPAAKSAEKAPRRLSTRRGSRAPDRNSPHIPRAGALPNNGPGQLAGGALPSPHTDSRASASPGGGVAKNGIVKILDYADKTLVVEVVSAKGLKDISIFGQMDPYVKAILMPGFSEGITPVAEAGNCNPVWDDGINEIFRNKVLLHPKTGNKLLQLEVWNQGATSDELIGSLQLATIDSGGFGGYGKRIEYKLEGGNGILECRIYFMQPINCSSISVGCRCRRGPHWTHGEKYDGGEGKLGTITGYKLEDGTRVGKFPSHLAPMTAVVEWDQPQEPHFKSGFYPIGALVPAEGMPDGTARFDLACLEGAASDEEQQKKHAEDMRMKKEADDIRKAQLLEDKQKTDAADAKKKKADETEEARLQKERAEELRLREVGDRDKAERLRKKRNLKEAKSAVRVQSFIRMRTAVGRYAIRIKSFRAQQRQQKVEATVQFQRVMRGWYQRAIYKEQRALILVVQALVRGWSLRRMVRKRTELALKMQKSFRGCRFLQLVKSINNGALCAEVMSVRSLSEGKSIKNLWSNGSPYVKVMLQPSGIAGRTKKISGAGSDADFRASNDNQIILGMQGSGTSKVLVEVWNDNGGVFGDSLLGSVVLPMPFSTMRNAQPETHTLDPQGELTLRYYLLPNELYLKSASKSKGGEDAPAAPRRITTLTAPRREKKNQHGFAKQQGGWLPGIPENIACETSMLGAGETRAKGVQFLVCQVHGASCIRNANMILPQSPYIIATFLPARNGKSYSIPCFGGGTSPEWDQTVGGGLHIVLAAEPGAISVQLQLWSKNTTTDDFLGQAEVRLTQQTLQMGKTLQHNLDTGGSVKVTFR
jgi:hypothetical protein